MEVPDEETSRYGVIGGQRVEGEDSRLWKVDRLVEKPEPGFVARPTSRSSGATS